ncbi:MAG TPA: hypothetical protein VKB69_07280, partial [Micromonosporaceae bacterium]|nr:hypothetical protein [Micromonosporaceae bacterium]
MLAAVVSALVVAASWGQFAWADVTIYVQDGDPRDLRTWNVWSDLAFVGPLRAAVVLSALVTVLATLTVFNRDTPLSRRLALFASASSVAILAGYLAARKYNLFDQPDDPWGTFVGGPGTPGYTLVPRHSLDPQNGWGAYTMFGLAAA